MHKLQTEIQSFWSLNTSCLLLLGKNVLISWVLANVCDRLFKPFFFFHRLFILFWPGCFTKHRVLTIIISVKEVHSNITDYKPLPRDSLCSWRYCVGSIKVLAAET